jgi:hypothetical protein
MGIHMGWYSPFRRHLLHARNMPGSGSQSAVVSEQSVWQSCPHMGDECPRPNTRFIGRLVANQAGAPLTTVLQRICRLRKMGDLVWMARKGVPQGLNLNFLYVDAG